MITSLGEERAGLCLVHVFAYFARVDFCPSSLPIGVGARLRFVSVALRGLF